MCAPTVTAFIPVKSLALVKSRLSGKLDLNNRIQLTHESLRRIVHVLQTVPRIEQIVIISRDPQVAEWAEWWQVSLFREERAGLNEALRDARAATSSAQAILVLPSDLVALSDTDVNGILDAANRASPCVVIAPDRHDLGTNALLLCPPDVIDFRFGVDSAQQHAQLARDAGVAPVFYRSDSISLDLDSPDDFALYWDQW